MEAEVIPVLRVADADEAVGATRKFGAER